MRPHPPLMPLPQRYRLILRRSMDTSTVVIIAGAVIMLAAVYWKSPEAANKGLSATGALILEITPRMLAAFTLAGLFQAVIPEDVIVRWMGHGSGVRGLLSGMTLGSVYTGRPDNPLSGGRVAFQDGCRYRAAGCLSHGLVSVRFATHHHVGDSASRRAGRDCSRCREFLFPFHLRLALRSRVE